MILKVNTQVQTIHYRKNFISQNPQNSKVYGDIMNKREIEMFELFLNNHNALAKFKDNVENYRGRSYTNILVQTTRTPSIIDRNMSWRNTPQGYNFWSDLNDVWRQHCFEEFKNLEGQKYKSIW